ncbi:hypothetical protein CDV31_017203 [Fusarium ambrosium]|uniref:Transcriptional activator HAP2 n=1 Tax=Fusarium ambrosium TaxID=131363 RepID=A0A428RPQ4_9HYPO|nr:hypothetical protein CDV31_017203 [Fusarium ambrosium]
MSQDQQYAPWQSKPKDPDAPPIDPSLGHAWIDAFVKKETHQSSESSLLTQPRGFLSRPVMSPRDQIPPSIPSNSQPHVPETKPAQPDETPLYVNAKQFHRILKRRAARQRLEEHLRPTSEGRRPYLHESRHKHAMRRPRGPGGRFLTKEEIAASKGGQGHVNDARVTK